MNSVPVSNFWFFGTNVRYLQDASEGMTVHGQGRILKNIELLFQYLDDLELRVTKRAASDLSHIQAELKSTSSDAKLTSQQAKKLSQAVTDLRKTLTAELRGINAYSLSPKRLDINKLLEDVPSLFAPNVFQSLSTVAQYDLLEGAKCVAFERPTAAAFHLMRATEEVLRNYYCYYVRRERLNPMLWYPMVQALQKHKKAKINDVLHRNLDNIRLSFRNPTQHPDKVYDIHEVQDLFGLCVDVINRMMKCMHTENKVAA